MIGGRAWTDIQPEDIAGPPPSKRALLPALLTRIVPVRKA